MFPGDRFYIFRLVRVSELKYVAYLQRPTRADGREADGKSKQAVEYVADPAGRLISSLYLSNPSTQASDSRYFQYDGLGNVISRTNQQGNQVSSYSYEAFGAITSQTGQPFDFAQGKLGNAYTYMGQAYDSSTGLYYFNARWYDASIGRFISADPLPGNPFQSGSTNRYAYALNNPIAYEDVSGLKSVRAASAQQANATADSESNLDRLVLAAALAIAATVAAVILALVIPTAGLGVIIVLAAIGIGFLAGFVYEFGRQIGLGKGPDELNWAAILEAALWGAFLAAVFVIGALFLPALLPAVTLGVTLEFAALLGSANFWLGMLRGFIEATTPEPAFP